MSRLRHRSAERLPARWRSATARRIHRRRLLLAAREPAIYAQSCDAVVRYGSCWQYFRSEDGFADQQSDGDPELLVCGERRLRDQLERNYLRLLPGVEGEMQSCRYFLPEGGRCGQRRSHNYRQHVVQPATCNAYGNGFGWRHCAFDVHAGQPYVLHSGSEYNERGQKGYGEEHQCQHGDIRHDYIQRRIPRTGSGTPACLNGLLLNAGQAAR